MPTFAPEQAYRTLESLIREDGSCDLPCWLGVEPGITDFREMERAFSQFSAIGFPELYQGDMFLLLNYPSYVLDTQVHPGVNGKVGYVKLQAPIRIVDDQPRDYGDASYAAMLHRYTLPAVLMRYGLPGAVYLDTTRMAADPATIFPFVLWVIYPDQGFLLRYHGDNAMVGQDIKICPLQSELRLVTWDTEQFDFEQFIEGDGALATSPGPQPINEVTDLGESSFFDRFRDAQPDDCFFTPASLWPPEAK